MTMQVTYITKAVTTIKEFAVAYNNGYFDDGVSYISYDVTEKLNKIIPTELFHTAGSHIYMGKEYGFIVYTFTQNDGISFSSNFMLIDFSTGHYVETGSEELDNSGEELRQQMYYEVEPVLQSFVNTTNANGEWKITQPYSYAGFNIFLKDVAISALVRNENEYNIPSGSIEADSKYNKKVDTGSIIEVGEITYNFHELKGADYAKVEEMTLSGVTAGVVKLIEFLDIPYISKGIGVANEIVAFARESEAFYDAVVDARKVSFNKKGSGYFSYRANNKEGQTKDSNAYTRYFAVRFNEKEESAGALMLTGARIDEDDKTIYENSKIKMEIVLDGAWAQVIAFIIRMRGLILQ